MPAIAGEKDVDFPRREILVREGRGFKGRVTMLPNSSFGLLGTHLLREKALHEADLAAGFGIQKSSTARTLPK